MFNPLVDPTGKPSAMRAASLLTVAAGCIVILGAAFGKATPEMADEAIWLVGLGLGGKFVQRVAEGSKSKSDSE